MKASPIVTRTPAGIADPRASPPLTRRAVFLDLEDSSCVEHVSWMLEHLELGTPYPQTRLTAVGNWGAIGQEVAGLLSAYGAELLHATPACGVKAWRHLRIAVAAGVWLGSARPCDILEVITDDQALDAIGDVAAGLGVNFRRLSCRALAEANKIHAAESGRDTRPGHRPTTDRR